MWRRLRNEIRRQALRRLSPAAGEQQLEWVRLQTAWLLRAVVRADDVVTEEEQALLRSFLGERFGPDFAFQGAFGGDPPQPGGSDLKELASQLASSLSRSECETVLDWCCQLASADGRVTEVEVAHLEPIARGLGLAQRELLRLLARDRRANSSEGGEPPLMGEVLGLPPGATQEAIHARYRELVREFHPDRHEHLGEQAAREAEARFLEIRRAYEALREAN